MKSRCMNCMRKLENDTGTCPHCSFDPGRYKPPEQTLPPGATLYNGKYIIGRVLGRGGFGVTYVALDTTLELRVAIKECLPRNCAWRNDSGASVQWGLSVPEQEAMLESFVKEARKMAKIDQIPGVVRVREYFYDNETAYIVMDYVEGETLAQYLRRNGSLSAEACFRLLAPAMDSLAEAHKRGLIHRDISPNNIMIERDGKKVWVLDLGAAKDLGSRISAPNVSAGTQIIGTPGYTPLEQYDPDGKIGPWTDIYAMSSTFFHCMTGQKPPASTSRVRKDNVPELLRTIRGSVGAVLEKGLAQNQDDRYQSMTELRDALEKAIDDTAHTKTYEGATEILTREPEEPKPHPKKHMLALFLVLFVGLALVVFGMIRLNGKPSAEIIASGECGDNASWTLDENGLLTISGTGGMANYGHEPWDAPYQAYQEAILSVKIQDGITYIGDSAFFECKNLQSVDIPDSVTNIYHNAFSKCIGLESVTLPAHLNFIGANAFMQCTSLTSIEIPESLTFLNACVFDGCSNLTSAKLPDTLTSIGAFSFHDCKSLQSVEIPNSVQAIGKYAFASCEALTSLKIPDGVETIGEWAFGGDKALISVEISDSVTEIGAAAFYDCTNLSDVTLSNRMTQISADCFGHSALKRVTIPGRVTEIAENAFRECASLESVLFSNGVTVIGQYAFCGDSSLTNVELPDTLRKIDGHAFENCASLASITIPNGVTEIGEFAFHNCVRLSEINELFNVQEFGEGSFRNTSLKGIAHMTTVQTENIF